MKRFMYLLVSIIITFMCVNIETKADEIEPYLINRFSFSDSVQGDYYNRFLYNVSFFSDHINININAEVSCNRVPETLSFSLEFSDSEFVRSIDSDYVKPSSYTYTSNNMIRERYSVISMHEQRSTYTTGGYYTYYYTSNIRLDKKNSAIVDDNDYITINSKSICCDGEAFSSIINGFYAASNIIVQDPNHFGDINFDNKIDADDAQLTLQYYLTNLSNQNSGTMIDYVKSNGYDIDEEYLFNKDDVDKKYNFKEPLIDRATEYAKKLYEAAKHAVYDLAVEDENLSGLTTGSGIDVGGTSAVTSAPASGAAALNKFKYRVYVYFTDATKLTAAQVQLDGNYNVVGVGVQDKNNYCGSYPKQMTVDSYDNLSARTAHVALNYSMT